MLVMLVGMMTVPMDQPANAPLPMLVTLLGIMMLVMPEQALNAPFPILMILVGIVMLVSPEQVSKEESAMFVILFGRVRLVIRKQPANMPFPVKASVVRHTDGHLFSTARARVTFSRMSVALAV